MKTLEKMSFMVFHFFLSFVVSLRPKIVLVLKSRSRFKRDLTDCDDKVRISDGREEVRLIERRLIEKHLSAQNITYQTTISQNITDMMI